MTQNISSMTTADLINSLTTSAEDARSGTEPETPIGKYGKMAMAYMEKTNPNRLNFLTMENRHREIFREVDERAWQRMEKVTAQLQRQRPRPSGQLHGAGAVRQPNPQRRRKPLQNPYRSRKRAPSLRIILPRM
ncbi:MAG: TnpV protein [Candidatus Fimivivens sp.]